MCCFLLDPSVFGFPTTATDEDDLQYWCLHGNCVLTHVDCEKFDLTQPSYNILFGMFMSHIFVHLWVKYLAS